jgi:UDP:flavonoid glycosyltransferase YjiC (YdhE family)
LRTVVFYISGHGFGHASRSIEVINALIARAGDVRVIARTSAAAWLFDKTIRNRQAFRREELATDTGAVQIDSLHLDEAQTVARATAFMRTFDERVAQEAVALGHHGAALVVSDIPALGIAAANRAGIPGVALGNFTWDWIYAAYPGGQDAARAIGDAYAGANLALRLPMHGGFGTFEHIVDLPFVARRSARRPEETRHALGLPTGRRLVLLSFGGYGVDRIDHAALERLNGYAVIGSVHHPLDEAAMYEAGFRYEDLVRAVDVVVSKPGYGIISECVANDTAFLYTSRGHFVEYDVLVRDCPRYLRSAFIDHDQLFAGDWQAHLDRLLTQPAAPERPRVDGADVAAELLLGMI